MALDPADVSSLRVAVVHDWLTGMRGGEKVLEAILDLFPRAEIFTLFHFEGKLSAKIERHRIHTSPIQAVASVVSDYRKLLLAFPLAVRSWDFSSFDLVISSSHCVAKGVETGGVPHVSYCHTPMRYIWDRFDDYFPPSRRVLRTAVSAALPWLQRWDRETSRGVTAFAANSEFVRQRIRQYYGRDSEVIHPFADDSFFDPPLVEEREDYHVVLSALVPYKKIDLAVQAAAESGIRLVVAGSGPLLDELRRQSPPNVSFVGFVSEGAIHGLLARGRSLIIPGVEDFGITAVEAMALGTPVVAFGTGGVLDSVRERITGILFHEPTSASLASAMREVERNNWDRAVIREQARNFTRAEFLRRFFALVDRHIQQ